MVALKGLSMRFPILVVLLGLLFVLTGCQESQPEASATAEAEPAPLGLDDRLPVDPNLNVIIISFDALRTDALGVYGNDLPVSPNLDAFAEQAVVFDRFYSAAQSTPTSFAASFTGQYPFKVFLKWNLAQVPTLAEKFTAAGYRTAGFFNNRQLDPDRNFGQGFETYEVDYQPHEIAFLEKPLQWVETVKDEQFFLWIHFISPHAPYKKRQISDAFYSPGYYGRFANGSGAINKIGNIHVPEDLVRFKELYTGEVHYADHLFGTVMEALEKNGLVDRSLMVVTADHGEGLMQHGALFHNQVYDEVVRVPLIIRHPAMPVGARSNVRACNIDLFPTLAGMMGLEAPTGIDGIDFRPDDLAPRPLLMTAMTNVDWRSMGMIWGDHKFIINCIKGGGDRRELYDLVTDPHEVTNLYKSQPVLADSLVEIMEAMTNVGPCKAIREASSGRSPTENMSARKIQQLRSLGYVR
jgi:arylsulfatase A-like enzyme